MSQTSGTRTPARNAQVGGHPHSVHLFPGLARDYVPDDPSQAADIVADAHRMGLWGLWHEGHVHLQALPPRS